MLKRNLIANYLGQGWASLMGLAFIPIYIKYLGIEAYGLIGLFAVLQAWLSLLDMGMTPTLNREMARFIGGAHNAESIRDLLRSIEIIAVSIALLLGLVIWAGSDWLANDWLRTDELSIDIVAQALAIMGAVIAFRFIEGIYRSALFGLQRQVLYNVVNCGLATVRWPGAVVVLIWVTPTIQAFFIWQGIVSILSLLVLTSITYKTLPTIGRSGKFSILALGRISRFAGGMMGITFLTILLTQVDKILLAKLLTLSDYGYYTLSTIVAGALTMLIAPITQAWFPRLSELHAAGNQADFIRKYHLGAQLVSVIMGSAAITMILFAKSILLVWTGNAELADRSASLLSILALGNLLNGLMWIPYQAQLAHGWTGLATHTNIISVILIVPAIFWATPRYGAEGAAWVWVILNTGYVFIGSHYMYRKILTKEKYIWFTQDLLRPLFFATVVAISGAWIMPESLTSPIQLAWLAIVSVVTLISAAFAASDLRTYLLRQVGKKLKFNKGASEPL